jgi:N-dimethylarginine dimethylaminohydrolase
MERRHTLIRRVERSCSGGLTGLPLRLAYPELAKGIAEQTEALVRALQDCGVIVHRPRLLTDAEIALLPVGLSNQYARDRQIVIGKHIIETNCG